MNFYKVTVLKSSFASYWYSKSIGKMYCVAELDNDEEDYLVLNTAARRELTPLDTTNDRIIQLNTIGDIYCLKKTDCRIERTLELKHFKPVRFERRKTISVPISSLALNSKEER